eukprot:gene7517-664_t
MVPPKQPSDISAVSVMLCLLALYTSLPGADAHVFMTAPLSRVRVLGNPDWVAAGGNGLGNPIRYYPDGSFYNDKADVCGDPHQQNDGGVGGFTGAVNNPQPWSVVYSAGDTIQVTQKMNTWHGGYMMIKLCPTARSGATQGCFDQYPLVREYHTGNSCVDTCSAAECGKYATNGLDRCGTTAARKEIFRDCADIRITGSGTPSGSSGTLSGGSGTPTVALALPLTDQTGGVDQILAMPSACQATAAAQVDGVATPLLTATLTCVPEAHPHHLRRRRRRSAALARAPHVQAATTVTSATFRSLSADASLRMLKEAAYRVLYYNPQLPATDDRTSTMVPPKQPSDISAVSVMLCLLALYTSLPGADAHVFMTAPLSRVRVLGNPDWVAAGGNGLGNPIRYYPDGSFYNDKADVCGDPHQQNDGGVGGFTGAVNNPQPWS